MTTHTELAIERFFNNNTKMECDKVYHNGESEVVTFNNPYEVIQEVNNANDYELYMPI
tara:strand:+ start:1735 stop:1908 length:174 start_codon:yes stop_codon:yes gene_type:complete